jgi:hypothetical protein
VSSNITTLARLYVEITRLLDGEDVTLSDVSVATLERLLVVAQQRIYRDVHCRFNEKAFDDVVVTNNLAPLPADFKDLSVIHFGRRTLIPVDEAVLRDYWASTGSGVEKYVARSGNDLTFWPAIADGTALQGRYYFAWPDLSDATDNFADNLLFQEADDLFIYGCLAESAAFFGESEKLPLWQAKYLSIATELNKQSHRAVYAGRLQVRPSARLCGAKA